jgi:hypothetical protein
MTDPTEDIRKQMIADINAAPGSREFLEHKHGQVWDTGQLSGLRGDGLHGSPRRRPQEERRAEREPHVPGKPSVLLRL